MTSQKDDIVVNVPFTTQTGIDTYKDGFATRVFNSTDTMQEVFTWALKVNPSIKLHEINFGRLHND